MNQGIWREKGTSSGGGGDLKRPHDVDPPLPNKKQALHVDTPPLLWPPLGFDERYLVSDNESSFGLLHEVNDHENVMSVSQYKACGGGGGGGGVMYTVPETTPHSSSSTIISFGGYDDDDDKDFANYSNVLNSAVTKTRKDMSKKKPPPSNNFPPNVRSLLSTGILDGVPVKYIAWSREKQLPGVIKGSGYLCGCHSCNYSQVINAYEFERHAGCKTKHPNNHIYFDNGKTIYGAVQELKTTPQNLLLDAIQTVAGSPINQESFRLWKVSFMAATCELKRIYSGNNHI